MHVLEMKYNGVQEIEGKTTLKDTEGGKITIEWWDWIMAYKMFHLNII